MYRTFTDTLIAWADRPHPKPLIVRGARQVGKTFSISAFGREHFDGFVRLDFEQQPALKHLFGDDLAPRALLPQIEAYTGGRIRPGQTLLFFDEIQACPAALRSLRYFRDQLPGLHIVTAGSLLEFSLSDSSFPVGSVEYGWLYPMNFEEFVLAVAGESLAGFLPRLHTDTPLPAPIHDKLLRLVRTYFMVGGMPEAVAVFRETNSLIEVSRVHAALLQSYLDDMHKYRGRMEIDGVDRLLAAVAGTVGTQVKYSRIEPDWRIEKTKRVLHLLEKTMLIHPVRATAATGLPLGATASGKILKYLFLDVGLLRHLLGAPADMLYREELLSILRGALAEQFIGQQLAAAGGCEHHRLYYWTRRKKSSTAEVDYVISREGAVVPIEVKSGAPGRLKSLSIFLREHPATPRGVVLSTRNVEIVPRHKLHYLPLYAKLKG